MQEEGHGGQGALLCKGVVIAEQRTDEANTDTHGNHATIANNRQIKVHRYGVIDGKKNGGKDDVIRKHIANDTTEARSNGVFSVGVVMDEVRVHGYISFVM